MSQHSGPAAPGQASMGVAALRSRTGAVSHRLTGIRALARLRPGLVMAGTAFAGLIAGRLTRRSPAGPGGGRARERGQS
jgi:hypothetical protein